MPSNRPPNPHDIELTRRLLAAAKNEGGPNNIFLVRDATYQLLKHVWYALPAMLDELEANRLESRVR